MPRRLHILMIEDNPGDATLVQEALSEVAADVTLHQVLNGVLGLAYLGKQSDYSWKPTPDLVLLDINLPLLDGFQTLAAIKSSAEMREVPVIMLSSSRRDEDREEALRLGALAFSVKPASWDGYVALVSSVVAGMRERAALAERAGLTPRRPPETPGEPPA